MNLVLFMTRGMSLTAWQENGSLERELSLYAELAKWSCTVSIISWGDGRDKIIAARYPWLRVYVNQWHLPQHRYERLMPILHAWPLARADIIKSNQINGADCALRCARLWQKPFVARCGYIWSETCKKTGSSDLAAARDIEREVYANCAAGIVTTKEVRDFFVQHYKIPGDRLSVLPNYVPENYFELSLPDYAAPPQPIITQVGRLAEEKNCFALIEACAGLAVTLRFVGEGPLQGALRQYAEQLGVTVEFTGTVATTELPRLLGESTVCTLVSLYEGHPKSLIEAMARGCAVLGTRVPGIAPLIAHGQNGLLCDADAASIRAGLERLLQDSALRERLGQHARLSAGQYGVRSIAEKELALFATLPVAGARQKGGVFLHFVARAFSKIPVLLWKKVSQRAIRCMERWVAYAFRSLVRRKEPRAALRLLFGLEAWLYPLEGSLAVAYDGGVHTKHRHTRYHDFFVERLRPGERVVDIGCGNGFLAHDMVCNAGAVVTGIELSAENMATACRKYSHPDLRFIQGDALRDLPDQKFDTVVLSNVLEHLPGRVAFLRKVRERVHPKRFLLRVPLFERDWRVPLKKELGVEWRLDPTHETEYTAETFACELARAGLFITYQEIRWGEIWCEAQSDIPYAQERPANPRVTVLMGVHNDETHLAGAISSILWQTEREFVFVIIDDASTDGTAKILDELSSRDARITVCRNESRLGLTASLNRGLAHCHTPYVARMDSDDLALPQRLARQLAYMEAHPEMAAAGSHVLQFDEDNPESAPWEWHVPTSPVRIRHRTLTEGPQLSHPAAIVRTDAILAVGKYREQFATTQDYDLWLRLLERYELGNVPETLLFYRQHESAVSRKKTLEQSVNHVLAMRSAELRGEGKADPLLGRELDVPLLFSLLDISRPSYRAWLRLLAQRPLPDKAELLLRTLRLLPEDVEDAAYAVSLTPPDWKRIHDVLASAGGLAHEPRYGELCRAAWRLGEQSGSTTVKGANLTGPPHMFQAVRGAR